MNTVEIIIATILLTIVAMWCFLRLSEERNYYKVKEKLEAEGSSMPDLKKKIDLEMIIHNLQEKLK
tara:strand:- start:1091 stop:1288 length:198 start_codon:yes stop_codon:yes gene_type:complete